MTNKYLIVAISAVLMVGLPSFQAPLAAEPSAAATPAAPPPTDAAATAAPAANAAPVAPASASASESHSAATAATTGTQAAADPGDEIVCKKQDIFGSRVRKSKVCRTKKEWQMESQAAKDYTKGVSKGSAPGPGGETLPAGG
jgi:hypothetical protein